MYHDITATFTPRRADDLRPELVPLIGKRLTLKYAGTGEDGEPYPNQRRWYSEETEWYWLPECDLSDIDGGPAQ